MLKLRGFRPFYHSLKRRSTSPCNREPSAPCRYLRRARRVAGSGTRSGTSSGWGPRRSRPSAASRPPSSPSTTIDVIWISFHAYVSYHWRHIPLRPKAQDKQGHVVGAVTKVPKQVAYHHVSDTTEGAHGWFSTRRSLSGVGRIDPAIAPPLTVSCAQPIIPSLANHW